MRQIFLSFEILCVIYYLIRLSLKHCTVLLYSLRLGAELGGGWTEKISRTNVVVVY